MLVQRDQLYLRCDVDKLLNCLLRSFLLRLLRLNLGNLRRLRLLYLLLFLKQLLLLNLFNLLPLIILHNIIHIAEQSLPKTISDHTILRYTNMFLEFYNWCFSFLSIKAIDSQRYVVMHYRLGIRTEFLDISHHLNDWNFKDEIKHLLQWLNFFIRHSFRNLLENFR